MAVAGRQVGAGLGDADDRLAGLQLLAGEAEIQVALEIERGHVGIVGIVEPELGAQLVAAGGNALRDVGRRMRGRRDGSLALARRLGLGRCGLRTAGLAAAFADAPLAPALPLFIAPEALSAFSLTPLSLPLPAIVSEPLIFWLLHPADRDRTDLIGGGQLHSKSRRKSTLDPCGTRKAALAVLALTPMRPSQGPMLRRLHELRGGGCARCAIAVQGR